MLLKTNRVKECINKIKKTSIGTIYSSFIHEENNKLFIVVDGKYDGFELREYDLETYSMRNCLNLATSSVTFKHFLCEQLKDKGIYIIRLNEENKEFVYDSNNSKVLVEPGLFDTFYISSDEVSNASARDAINYPKSYNAIIGTFDIESRDESDIYSYIDSLTQSTVICDFGVTEGRYYAMINMDGTIRSNRLFKGEGLSKINYTVNLEEFKSLEAFKQYRREVVNRRKNNQKKEFLKSMETYGAYFPYQNDTILKLLK